MGECLVHGELSPGSADMSHLLEVWLGVGFQEPRVKCFIEQKVKAKELEAVWESHEGRLLRADCVEHVAHRLANLTKDRLCCDTCVSASSTA